VTRRSMPDKRQGTMHHDPEAVGTLLSNRMMAPLWIIPRVYVGWVMLNIGWPLTRSSEWMAHGGALRAALSSGSENQSWASSGDGLHGGITSFLVQSGAVDWIARLTAVGMTLAGIALILGLMSGIAAFAGIILSVNVIIAGSTEPGPLVLGLAVLLVLGWKTAGWFGLDHWVLPALGAPWKGGALTSSQVVVAEIAQQTLEVTE
jgi:thiosulfate dehydrogenase (quinone) large subunit